MKVTYKDHMGSDLSVVNAARVSFSKEHDSFDTDKDTKLISYLAKHNHWSPFAHTSIQLHIKAPIFVARQLVKHQVGLVWNEVSRRYVDNEPEFYTPDKWRKKADNVKQGSSETEIESACWADEAYDSFVRKATDLYGDLLYENVAPELARMVLPQSMYTEWIWTGSVMAFARVCNQRLDPHAQEETRIIAQQISDIIEPLYPVSWKALVG